MAKFVFTKKGSTIIIECEELDYYKSINLATARNNNERLDFFSNGVIADSFPLVQIDTIGGATPATINEAVDLLCGLTDSSSGSSGDIVDAINSLKDTLIEKSDEEIEAIEDLKTPLATANVEVNISLNPDDSITREVLFAEVLDGVIYGIEVGGLPTGLTVTSSTEQGKVLVNIENKTQAEIIINTTMIVVVKKTM